MRNVSKKYIETMETRRDFYAVGEITFADGTQKTLNKEDFTLTGNSVIDSAGSTSFPLGLLVPKQIQISLMNDDDRWSEYDFYWAKIYLQTKFDLDDGTTESLNIGTFTVISPENYGTTIVVTAMDDSYKTDKPYDTQNDYPMSVAVALRDCCSTCDILLGTNSFPNSDYVIPQKPENITHRQFIGLCAQIAGGNARFDEFNRLEIIAYDFSPLETDVIDGGTFEPWTEGENYDGGTFNPWTTGDTIDGGTFGDRDNIHVLYQYKSGIVIEVDDVVITGVQMESEDEEGNKSTHLYGKEGYVLSLENQLAVGKEEEVLRRIGEKIVGITFRPFSGDHIALPTAEFMDLAYIIDRKQNVYKTVLTDVTFNYFGYTNLKCAADSPLRNSSTHLSNEVKAIIEARKMVERERTEREKALDNLADQLAKSSGLYLTEDVQPDKSVIYYMHDKPTLEESMIVWKLTANAFGISNDGGKTYPYGLDASGVAILERIYAIGINCNYLKTGSIKIEKNGKVMVLMDMDTGQVILRPDTFELSSGATIQSIAEDAANDKSKTFTSTPTPPYHVGDLWYGGTSSDVKVCTRERLTGSYNSGDWAKRDRYIDSSTASSTASSAANTAVNNAMTQKNIFDKLTGGGANQGIYLQDGKLYLNATYMQIGKISSKNGKVYFDLDNNELRCTRLIGASGSGATTVADIGNTAGTESSQSRFRIYQDGHDNISLLMMASYSNSRATITGSSLTRLSMICSDSDISLYQKYISLMSTSSSSAGTARVKLTGSSGKVEIEEDASVSGNMTVSGNLRVSGTKPRLVETENYGSRLQYCYETPTPFFGDIGEGITDEKGECCVFLDDIFLETVSSQTEYHVFLQKEGPGDIWVEEKAPQYFTVKGTEGLRFAWEIKVVQKGFEFERLDEDDAIPNETETDRLIKGIQYFSDLDSENVLQEFFDEEVVEENALDYYVSDLEDFEMKTDAYIKNMEDKIYDSN